MARVLLATITFLGDRQDIFDPEAVMLVDSDLLRPHGGRLPTRSALASTHNVNEFFSRDRLLLEKLGDDGVEGDTVVAEQHACSLLGLVEQPAHFLVDDLLGALGVRAFGAEWRSALGWSVRSVADGPESWREAPLGHHLDGQLGRTREVAGRAGGGLTDDQILRGPATEADGQRVEQVTLRVEVPFVDGELLGDPEGASGGQDRDLGHRIGVI